MQNISKNGTPEQQQRAKATLKGLAEGVLSLLVGSLVSGVQTKWLVWFTRGSMLYQKSQVDQSTGTPRIGSNQTINITIQAGAFMGSQQDARKYASLIMGAWRDVQSSNGVMA